jgi:Ca-activated chloride channel family protein
MRKEMLVPLVLLVGLTMACGLSGPAASPEGVTVGEEAPSEEEAPTVVEAMDLGGMALEEAAPAEFEMAVAPMVEAGQPMPAPTATVAGPEAMPDMMFFEDYGLNPFFDTSVDNLSTFAIDVDTGSYTLARRYLTDGLLPPPEAVRLEEFVNYFDQDYPLPEQGEVFNIVMEAAPTPFSSEGNYVLRIGIQGYDVPPEARLNATLIFVIDVSGSMDREDRLEAVKLALYDLVDNLRPTDQVGIVVYGDVGEVLLEPTPVSEPSAIITAIDRLQPDGSTNAEEGLRLAYQMATEYYDAGRINRIILCSDGVANVGATGPDAILETVRQQAREGITLTTVGFGMGNYNDVLMEQLADDGDGQYFYVDTHDEARRIFVDRLTGTLVSIAADARIQVEFNPEAVAYYRLMGYENRDIADEQFRDDTVDAGEAGAGHSVTALYEIVPAEQAGQGGVATVYLRWLDPDTGEPTEINESLGADEVLPSFEEASPRFQLDVVVAGFADLLGEGGWAQNITWSDLHAQAERVAEYLPEDADSQALADLIAQAMGLQP